MCTLATLTLAIVAVPSFVTPALVAQDPPAKAPPAAGKPMGWTGVLDEKEFAALHDLKADKAPKPQGSMVEIGGTAHYLSLPTNQKPPLGAVIVVHEWWGLNDHIKHWADRLAADGYAALAVDLTGGLVATPRDEAMAAMQAAGKDPAKSVATMRAAFDWLGGDERIRAERRAVIGWCFGGGMALQLALAEPKLDACAIYYGRLVDDSKALTAIRAPVLGIFGTKDKGIPPASVDAFEVAMKAAGRDCRILRYEANHAFANPSSAAYDQDNATKAWAEVRAFLQQKLAAKGAGKPPAVAEPAKK